MARAARQRSVRMRIQGASRREKTSATLASNIADAVEQVGRAVANEQPGNLREKLMRAGYHSLNAPALYVGAQALLLLVGVAIAAPLALTLNMSLLNRVCLGLAIVCIFTLLPNLLVSARQRQRRNEVRRHLPDAIDLLEICVSSGMGLDMAWNSVTDELRTVSPTLVDEMALANLEIHLGVPRAQALRHMADRTGVDEISSLVATLVQSERFGASIGQALRVYADSLRTDRSQRAEEAAEKLMVKLLLPMLVFIFPVLFIVILGPAGINIMNLFSGRGLGR
jgi:tight adherence protein C